MFALSLNLASSVALSPVRTLAAEPLSEQDYQKLVEAFTDSGKNIRKTKSDIFVYHYTEMNRDSRGSPPGIPSIRGTAKDLAKFNAKTKGVHDYLISIASYAWTPNGHIQTDGLYAATDPAASRDWGGTGDNWILVRIKIPAGSRFVNRDNRFVDDRSVREILDRSGCQFRGHINNSLDNLWLNEACKPIFEEVFKRTGAVGFYYRWYASGFEGCSEWDRSSNPLNLNTVVLMKPELVFEKNVAVFTQTNFKAEPNEEPDERQAIQALLGDPMARTYGNGHPRPLWPTAPIEKHPDIASWKSRHIQGCDQAEKPKTFLSPCGTAQDGSSPPTSATQLVKDLEPALTR